METRNDLDIDSKVLPAEHGKAYFRTSCSDLPRQTRLRPIQVLSETLNITLNLSRTLFREPLKP